MKQLVKGSLIALFITLLAGIGFYYFQQYSVISADPTDAISSDAAVIIEFKNGHEISAKLQHADLWKSLCEDSAILNFNQLIIRKQMIDGRIIFGIDVRSFFSFNKKCFTGERCFRSYGFRNFGVMFVERFKIKIPLKMFPV